MFRVISASRRLLAIRENNKAGKIFNSKEKLRLPAVRGGQRSLVTPSFFSRACSSERCMIGQHTVTSGLYQSIYTRSFLTVSRASRFSITHHAQSALKRIRLTGSHWNPLFAPIKKITCAVSWPFTRYHVVPAVLALTAGAPRTYAEGDCLPSTKNGILLHAEAGRTYLSSVVFSIIQGAILMFRAAYLMILFFPAITFAPFADSFGPEFRKTWLHLVHHTLEKAGPAFIKWGQWAATRPDLFPKDLCLELTKLHTKAPAHSFAYSKAIVEKAFGHKLSDLFEDFEEVPVASGSVAQVHRATIKFRYPGQPLRTPLEVAVKVRHPGVGDSIKRDFMIINTIARFSTFIPGLSWLRLDESVQQFAVFMMSQADLSREAAHLCRFIYNFSRWKDVSFPRPLYPLVHPSVLVETFEQGESIAHYVDELYGNDRIKKDLADIGTHAFLKMLLVDNFVHADLHPGNILVRVLQTKRVAKKLFRPKPHVIFLDVGMTAELSKSDRDNLLEFFKAVALRDGRTAAKCTLRLSQKQNCPNPKAFIEELERTFTFWGTPEGDIFHPVECMHQLLEQVRRHRVNVDGNICTVLVTILVLEGWQRKLDPNFDIMETLKTLLLKEDCAQPIDYFFS